MLNLNPWISLFFEHADKYVGWLDIKYTPELVQYFPVHLVQQHIYFLNSLKVDITV